MEEKKINREWVKTAAIIFLAVLLVLTFFSNTIMNRTLPEVASAEVTDGPITAKIRGTGTVSSVGQTEVKANATQSVATVKAREGAEVKAGDVLFVMGEAGEELENALEMLENAKFSLMEAYNSYPTDNSSGNKLVQLEQAMLQAKEARDIAYEAYKAQATEELQQELDKAEKERDEAQADFDKISVSVSSQEIAVDEAEAYLALQEKGTEEWLKAKEAYDKALAILHKLKDDLKAAEKILADKEAKYQAILSRFPTALYNTYLLAQQAYDEASSRYAAAQDEEAASASSQGKAAQSANIAVARAQADINRWEKKVAELSGGEDYAIKAPIGGTISALSVSPGEKVSKDQVMCIIEVPDLGYQMSFSVTNDQVKRIKVGDPATVSSFFWGSTIEAEVSSIKVDPKDPQSKKLITCTLDGDVEPGSEISVSIGNKSANYDVIVPNSAVRTDSNGSFVLMITSKNSPLGNRYFAERVPVEVLASDDTNSALNANLGYGDFVITTSSSPIKNGDQVRMADNG